MNILIIGGTRFQGPHLTKELLNDGHAVTVFHTGKHAVTARPGLTELVGDRNNPADLGQLARLEFDACVDTCAYFPSQIDFLATVLRTKHYTLISTVYVYADQDASLYEDAPLAQTLVAPANVHSVESYGALKARCEERAVHHFRQSCLLIRPSVIVGAGDHTERMSFWVRLIAKHQKRPLVHEPRRKMQLVDVRDLSKFVAKLAQQGQTGAVNVTGDAFNFNCLTAEIENQSGCNCITANLPQEYLAELPYLDAIRGGSYANGLAQSWGFTSRPITNSLADIFEYEEVMDFKAHRFLAQESLVLSLFP